MRDAFILIRDRMDRVGVLLSGLCALHCVLSIVLVTMLGLGGQVLLAPEIHRYGLVLAVLVGAVTLGIGAARHGQRLPLILGLVGVALMAAAIFAGHGVQEAVLTIAGVSLVAHAHIRNLRQAH